MYTYSQGGGRVRAYYTCVYAEWGRVLSVHYLDAISSVGACTVKIFSVLYLEEIGEPSSRTLNGMFR